MRIPLNLHQKTIGFIGAGNMAQAIIHGLIKSGQPESEIIASNRSIEKINLLQNRYPELKSAANNKEVAEIADIIIVAVKPQTLQEALSPLQTLDLSNKLIVSVAAGVDCQTFESILSQPLRCVRTMPNTPATLGLSATGLFANGHCSDIDKTLAENIFSAIGVCSWVSQESQMNIVTAIAGSAPAYYFLFLDAICQSAIAQGLPAETAKDLAIQTALGAATMAQQSDFSLDELRQQVTSPNGTTHAAITSFQHHQFDKIVDNAIRASVQRGLELAEIAKTSEQ